MRGPNRGNQFGIASIILTVVFCGVADAITSPSDLGRNHLLFTGVLAMIIATDSILAVLAAVLGSKWWFLALAGPLFGLVFLTNAAGVP